jgi:hypothetical protein
VVGFTLMYEMSYTNILAMLRLGKVTVRACERGRDEPVVVADEHLQRLDGEGTFLTNLRVSVFDDCAVEIYCDDHVRCKM